MSEMKKGECGEFKRGAISRIVIRWLWVETTRPALICIAMTISLIFYVALPIGSIFAIASIADNYGDIWALLFIPYVLLLPVLFKPFAMIFDGDIPS